VINNFSAVIDYAKNEELRVLIEISPNYKDIFIYCDDMPIKLQSMINKSINSSVKIHKIKTPLFVKYREDQEVVLLSENKGEIRRHFWKKINPVNMNTPIGLIRFFNVNEIQVKLVLKCINEYRKKDSRLKEKIKTSTGLIVNYRKNELLIYG